MAQIWMGNRAAAVMYVCGTKDKELRWMLGTKHTVYEAELAGYCWA
jgi:hypothetical protein